MNKLYLLVIVLIVLVVITTSIWYVVWGTEKFTNGVYEIIQTTEDHSYLVGNNGRIIMYSCVKNPRSYRVWAQETKVKGPIIMFINSLSDKYNRPYVILAHDFDKIEFLPKNIPGYSLYLVSSRISGSNQYTYTMPQNDDSFDGKVVNDSVPFENKRDEIIWRGGMNGIERYKLLNSMNNELCIKNNIQVATGNNDISKEDQLKCKYLLCIDGHGWPGSINWSLETKCCVFIRSDKHVWYYDLLVPWVDCIFIDNYDDLKEKLYRVHSNQNLAKSIGINGSNKIRKIYSLQKYYLELVFSGDFSHNELMDKLREKL
jgi:hypothetical protein